MAEYDCCSVDPRKADKSRPFPGDVAGKTGTIYIGQSHTRRGIVVLIRGTYGAAQSVVLSGSRGAIPLKFDAWANPDWTKDGKLCRHHWRLELDHRTIERRTGPGPWTVTVDGVHTFPVKDIKQRYQ